MANQLDMTESVKRALECPACLNYMKDKIFICVTGHSLCAECWNKLEQCPTCREALSHTRSYTMETIVSLLKFPCENSSHGCDRTVLLKEMNEHLDICRFPRADEKRNIWLAALNIPHVPKSAKICSDHFDPKDYTVKRDGKKMLKLDAVPEFLGPPLFPSILPDGFEPKDCIVKCEVDVPQFLGPLLSSSISSDRFDPEDCIVKREVDVVPEFLEPPILSSISTDRFDPKDCIVKREVDVPQFLGPLLSSSISSDRFDPEDCIVKLEVDVVAQFMDPPIPSPISSDRFDPKDCIVEHEVDVVPQFLRAPFFPSISTGCFRKYSCQLGRGCKWSGRKSQMEKHAIDTHRKNVLMGEENIFYWKNHMPKNEVTMIVAHKELFYFYKKTQGDQVHFVLQYIGNSEEGGNFSYQISVNSDRDKRKQFSGNEICYDDLSDIGTVIESGESVVIPINKMEAYRNVNEYTIYKLKIHKEDAD